MKNAKGLNHAGLSSSCSFKWEQFGVLAITVVKAVTICCNCRSVTATKIVAVIIKRTTTDFYVLANILHCNIIIYLKSNIMAKYSEKAGEKVEKTMHEMKEGKLKSGSGKKVTSKKQAVAIGLSEARKEGAKVPKK